MSSTDFAELGISAPVLKAVQQLGYEQPSPVQAQSIPILLEGKICSVRRKLVPEKPPRSHCRF